MPSLPLAAFVNINSPYIPEPGFITHESRRKGRFTMGQQIAARLYRWRRYGGGGVCQCERTSVKSGASIMQRGGSTSEIHPRRGRDAAPILGPKSIRHAAERYICSRRDERRNATENRRSNTKNYEYLHVFWNLNIY